MPREKKVNVEIMPRTEAALVLQQTVNLQVVLERMVRARVDEILAECRSAQLLPGFQPREVLNEIRQPQNVFERRKWALYFEKWGCQMCNRNKGVSHASNGHCSACQNRLQLRLAQIKLEYERNNPEAEIDRQIDRLTSRFRSAEALLGEREK